MVQVVQLGDNRRERALQQGMQQIGQGLQTWAGMEDRKRALDQQAGQQLMKTELDMAKMGISLTPEDRQSFMSYFKGEGESPLAPPQVQQQLQEQPVQQQLQEPQGMQFTPMQFGPQQQPPIQQPQAIDRQPQSMQQQQQAVGGVKGLFERVQEAQNRPYRETKEGRIQQEKANIWSESKIEAGKRVEAQNKAREAQRLAEKAEDTRLKNIQRQENIKIKEIESDKRRLGELTKMVIAPSSRTPFGRYKVQIDNADNALALIDSFGKVKPGETKQDQIARFNKADSRQIEEVVTSLDRLLSQSTPTIQGKEHLRPATFVGLAQKFGEKVTGSPRGMNQGQFIHRFFDTIKRERQVSAKKMIDSLGAIGAAYKDLIEKYPEETSKIIMGPPKEFVSPQMQEAMDQPQGVGQVPQQKGFIDPKTLTREQKIQMLRGQ